MTAADGVVYSDVRFRDLKNAEAAASPSNDTTYSEVQILKPQHNNSDLSAGGVPVSQVGSNGGSKVTSAKVPLIVLCILLAAAVVGLCLVCYDNVQTKRSLQLLTDKYENITSEEYMEGEDKWELSGKNCYYFSNNSLTWRESRIACLRAGGDLVKIDSRDEQKFLEEKLKTKMMFDEDKFWIGLTDSRKEGTWLWVDGSSLNTWLRFWSGKEPDNHEGENCAGEDCVRMGEREGTTDQKSWFDKSCESPHKSICEKETHEGVCAAHTCPSPRRP
ncbi:C-type lectin domain family 4 member E-like isoform X1 [Genypterus blacodes]|uniref:C-type lectin domain family 4 member E-like isoform X1 n=1 Tax=Genypterus blacodes TaxID=154954 RepID=UPI003F7758D7